MDTRGHRIRWTGRRALKKPKRAVVTLGVLDDGKLNNMTACLADGPKEPGAFAS